MGAPRAAMAGLTTAIKPRTSRGQQMRRGKGKKKRGRTLNSAHGEKGIFLTNTPLAASRIWLFFFFSLACKMLRELQMVAAWLLHSHLCSAAFKLTATPEQPPARLTPPAPPPPQASRILPSAATSGLLSWICTPGREPLGLPRTPAHGDGGGDNHPHHRVVSL